MVVALLAAGADANKATVPGSTPLLAAVYQGQDAVITAPLEAGTNADSAPLEAGTNADSAPLEAGTDADWAANAPYHPVGYTPLILAVYQGDEAVVMALLEAGADANKVFQTLNPKP